MKRRAVLDDARMSCLVQDLVKDAKACGRKDHLLSSACTALTVHGGITEAVMDEIKKMKKETKLKKKFFKKEAKKAPKSQFERTASVPRLHLFNKEEAEEAAETEGESREQRS